MPNFDYQIEPLDEMEDVLGVFNGVRGQVGQQHYVVTNRRLLMGPRDDQVAADIEAYVMNKAAAGAGDLLKNVLSHYAPMKRETLWLRHVVDVQPTEGSLINRPGLQITTVTGEVFHLSIMLSPRLTNWSRGDNDRRDQAVELIRAAMHAAKAAPPKSL